MLRAIFGENDFVVKQRKKALIAEYLDEFGSDIGLEQFDSSVEPQTLWQSVTAQPFLVSKKLVIVNNPSEKTELAEFLLEKSGEVPETTDLVIVEGKLDKRKAYYKGLKKLSNGEECNPLDDHAIADWLVKTAKEKGLALTKSQAQKIINRAGNDQWRLDSELEKLSVHDKLTDELIENLVELSPQETIFNLLDSLAAGNSKKALELYEGLRKQQLDPHYVMSMLAWQMDNILIVGFAGSRSDNQIAKEAKMNPYVVQKTRSLTRRLNKKSLENAVVLLTKTDEKLKSSTTSADDLVQFLIMQLAKVFA